MTARKKHHWPRCDAPLCKYEADYHVNLSGDQGELRANFCKEHHDGIQSVFPAYMSFVTCLRPIVMDKRGSLGIAYSMRLAIGERR